MTYVFPNIIYHLKLNPMKNSITQISLLIIFLILTACQKDSVILETLSLDESKIEARAKKHTVPFYTTFVSTVTIFPPQPNEEVCGVGAPVFNLVQTLEGNATHMGLMTGSISSCINPTTLPPTLFNVQMTLIAANGDELHLETQGVDTGTIDIVGGTGRFDGATGIVSGSFQPIEGSFPPSFHNELEGEIQY
jgi:hypothetical protein